jgi:hypothetical protein
MVIIQKMQMMVKTMTVKKDFGEQDGDDDGEDTVKKIFSEDGDGEQDGDDDGDEE